MSKNRWPVGDLSARRERVTRAAQRLAWSNFEVGVAISVPIVDTRADVALVLDAEEHRRRLAACTPAVPDFREVFLTLCTLPFAEAVRLRDLSRHDRSVVKELPPGVVKVDGGVVTCIVRPPVRATLSVVYDEEWRRGLGRASNFAPFGNRVLALTEDAGPELSLVALEAQLYGIGVTLVRPGADDQVVVHPEPWVQKYFGPVAWRNQEQVYSCWRRAAIEAES